MECYIIIILIIIILFMSNQENMNEGTFKYTYKPPAITNFSMDTYPICQKNVRNNNLNERYCDDKERPNMHYQVLYNNPRWILTKYPSFVYYNADLYKVNSPDYYHKFEI